MSASYQLHVSFMSASCRLDFGSPCLQVHNDPGCGSAPYSCQRSVSLFLPWEGELRLHAGGVTYEGQSLQLPHHLHQLQLERIGQYVLVTQPRGFTLAWEGGAGSVYIKPHPEFVGRTCGMCGNFNADVQDDLKTSYGVLTQDIEMFGNSWLEADPHQGPCPPVPSGFSSPCAGLDALVLQEVDELCALLLDPPFQSCHDFVSPLSYMASCSNDLCSSGPGGEVLCQVFSEYARACAHADHPLHGWRGQVPHCEKPCPLGLQQRECISCCPASCSLEPECIDTKLACLDGCYCPEGLIYENGGCVTPSECPCEYHGMVYPSGQMLQEECNNCTCTGGVWNCTERSCPGECSVTGDMYFQSFDGRIYTFPATCQYVLAKSRSSGRFTVTIQNAPCGANLDGACIQSVSLVVDEDPRTEITLSPAGEVFLAGQHRVSLPYSDAAYASEMCDVLNQDLFSACHEYVSPAGFQQRCRADACRCGAPCLCAALAHYARHCRRFSVIVDFRAHVPDCAVTCPATMQYGTCVSACRRRCSALSAPPRCGDECEEGCVCPEGSFYSQRTHTCVHRSECPCSFLGADYEPGDVVMTSAGVQLCLDGKLVAQAADSDGLCPAGQLYQNCSQEEDGPLAGRGVACERTCESHLLNITCPVHEPCVAGCSCPPGAWLPESRYFVDEFSDGPRVCVALLSAALPVDTAQSGILQDAYRRCLAEWRANGGAQTKAASFSSSENPNCLGLLGKPTRFGRASVGPLAESRLLTETGRRGNLLKHGDECFEPEACPCLWKGKEYFPGDRVSSPCYQCVCQHGSFQCTFRPCPSMCTAYGDRHYRTFDGLLFDYVGACKVYLVKSGADAMLSITAENVDCFDSGPICRKSLLVNIGRSFVAFDDDSGKPNPSSVIDRKQRMFIWPAGYFTVIHFPDDDVTLLWDRKTTVHVQVGPQWQGKLSGLCGNFDLKTVNEMRTPDNIASPTAQEFGNSWTATECVNSPDIRHPCSLSPLREPFAKRQCAILLGEVFQSCHPVVDVTWFYMNCLADTCACSRGGDCECFCTSVAAYAQRCCHEGVPVDWRSPALCPYDCEFYNKDFF
ncbi:unnamed protein product [Menidia menidia]|uniref:(Atlantic silverside) hypothetical protein n=1 Tax=Menidia menidia TaxID=238744 RepID=A0A8S4A560_9TELE|nr:unnamed protein product [Menidia menidia]